MKNTSLTVGSLAAFVVLRFLQGADLHVAPDAVEDFVIVVGQIFTAVGIWYGRYRHGDITWYGAKKKEVAPTE